MAPIFDNQLAIQIGELIGSVRELRDQSEDRGRQTEEQRREFQSIIQRIGQLERSASETKENVDRLVKFVDRIERRDTRIAGALLALGAIAGAASAALAGWHSLLGWIAKLMK